MSSTAAPLPRSLLWTMAIAAGATAANLYYNQPLLPEIARDLHASSRAMGLVPALTQAGYGLGMLFIVPLGDILQRRRLILVTTAATAVALAGVALAPNVWWLAAGSLLLGLTTVVPQIALPFAASLAPAESRGRVVGFIMSGLLVGILLSRTVAGLLGASTGWRAVFWVAAAAMVVLGVVLRGALPAQPPSSRLSYGPLLVSTLRLVREEPSLRLHALLGATSFAAFSAFWATLSLHLHALAPRHGPELSGLYGAVGVVGAVAAPVVGRFADRKGGRSMNLAALAALLASFVLLYTLRQSLWGMALAVVVLDFGTQANQVTNQARVYALREDARSRLNTVYMATYFAGGALGAWVGALAWGARGWLGVCLAGVAFTFAGLILLGAAALKARPGSARRVARANGP